MGIARDALLWVSRNQKLREALPKYKFIRRSVSRFMPGEEISDALKAAAKLKEIGIRTVVTHLGENVGEEKETVQVTGHYLDVLDRIHAGGLDTHISVKLTEMGLDQNADLCCSNLKSLLEKAASLKNFVWIDMEGSSYTEGTLRMFERARSEFDNVGLCLQSYLYRTREDLNRLLPLRPVIRLVKGAYAEPADIAFPRKQDNDENYFQLMRTLLSEAQTAIATHDETMIRRIAADAENKGISRDKYEVQMLYGIRSNLQKRLVQEGFCVRVLISYGSFWFPWYVRRLAERPANVWFVARNLFRV